MMEHAPWVDMLLMGLVVGVVALPALLLLCLKIKSSKKDPAIMGVAGVISPIAEKTAPVATPEATDDASFTPVARSSPRGPEAAGGGHRLNVSSSSSTGPVHVRTPSRTGDRRLPEIPRGDEDLYATVEGDDMDEPEPGPAPAYTRREHPYAKVKKKHKVEHPYATVKANGGSAGGAPQVRAGSSSSEDEEAHSLPLNRSSRSGSGRSDTPHLDGSMASRQATPLPPEPPSANPLGRTNGHFSGDSQDSSKGYTSITVREPAKSLKITRLTTDATYATLSETSDETYAAIEDPQSGHSQANSETYAVIDLPLEEDVPDGRRAHISRYSVAPHQHTYSKVDRSRRRLGGLDTPAPPPDPSRPTSNLEAMYAKVRKNRQEDLELPVGASAMGMGTRPKAPRPVEEPVSLPRAAPNGAHPNKAEIDFSGYELIYDRSKVSEGGYETVPDVVPAVATSRAARGRSHHGGYETLLHETGYEVMPDYWRSNHSSGYETVRDPGVEHAVRARPRDPGYEVIPPHRPPTRDPKAHPRQAPKDPGYESVRDQNAAPPMSEPPYAQVQSEEHASDSDIDYETIPNKYRGRAVSENDPGYEVLSRQPSEHGYETVPPPSAATASPALIHMSVTTMSSSSPRSSKSGSRSPDHPRRSSVVRIEHMEVSDVDGLDEEDPPTSRGSPAASPSVQKHIFV